jgi:AraC-like DNA-binding protein
MKQKPYIEKINPEFGTSIMVRQHSERKEIIQASWHMHPEIELVYVDKGSGKVHIGNHLSYFNKSQLLMLGANLPHNGFSDRLTARGSETIVQFKPDILGKTFLNLPESKSINALFERAKKGIRFDAVTKRKVGLKIQQLYKEEGFNRIILFLSILNDLAICNNYVLLNANGYALETRPQDTSRIDNIFKYINTNFERSIALEEIADQANMTVPAFCRYFKKETGKTFTKMVNEYRIVHATKLLAESNRSITDISLACGFNNFSHFNKLFNEVAGKTASAYRNELKKMVQ